MTKFKLVSFSALIILTFTVLIIIKKPASAPPKGVVEELFGKYKGKQGFSVISFPKFLIKQMVEKAEANVLKKEKFSNQKICLMIFHEKEKLAINQDSLNTEIINFLNEKNFKQLKTKVKAYNSKQIFTKPYENNWRESVVLFTGDSTLFAFNLINRLTNNEIVDLSNTLEKESTSFE
ncbi:MAG: hypothetical protein ACQESJ_02955 [Bacteroidota bacterium]